MSEEVRIIEREEAEELRPDIVKKDKCEWMCSWGDLVMFALVQQVWELEETRLKGEQTVRAEKINAKQRSELN